MKPLSDEESDSWLNSRHRSVMAANKSQTERGQTIAKPEIHDPEAREQFPETVDRETPLDQKNPALNMLRSVRPLHDRRVIGVGHGAA
jgi:hypothetical protein